MGGQNHQPCGKSGTNYLLYSTMMSRSVSQAYIALESANVCLEDILIIEINGHSSTVIPIVNSLKFSRQCLDDVHKHIEHLRHDMQKHHYTDLSTLHTTNLEELGKMLVQRHMVQSDAWNRISYIMSANGFYSVLEHFESILSQLMMETERLLKRIVALESIAEVGRVHMIVEQNKEENIKVEFAQLYTTWDRFHQDFLASSMLSTELWYAFIGVGSLVGMRNPQEQAA